MKHPRLGRLMLGERLSRLEVWVAAAFMLGTASCTTTSAKPVLLVFGDSLADSSRPAAQYLLGGKYTVIIRAAGGAAICDFLLESRWDDAYLHPSKVVIAMTGNNLSDCAKGAYERGGEPALVRNYREALIAMRRAFPGVPMSVMAAPASRPGMNGSQGAPNGDPTLNAMYRSVSAQYGMRYNTLADDALTPGHVFTMLRPSFPGTGPMVTVRKADGVHLTPAGSLYFGAAFAG